jgi:hypothetical protein
MYSTAGLRSTSDVPAVRLLQLFAIAILSGRAQSHGWKKAFLRD